MRGRGALGWMILGLLATPGPHALAGEKEYFFPEVTIDATIEPDGDLELTERRTFDFRGDFSFAYFTIEPVHAPPERIAQFTVHERGTELPVVLGEENGGLKAQWFFDARDERRTFTIHYQVHCAVDVYRDAAHLLWQFVGRGWTERTEKLRVTVHLPEVATGPVRRDAEPCPPKGLDPVLSSRPLAAGEARAWGHGPLGGSVLFPDQQTVEYTVTDLPPETFVEGSILLPVQAVPFAYQRPEVRRAQILSEEGELAVQANEARRAYLRDRGLARGLLALVPLVLMALVLIARRRDRVAGVPRHLQKPPEDMHPVELAYEWSSYRGRLSPNDAYRTQLLHLAQMGALEISAVGRVSEPEDFRLRLLRKPKGKLDQEFAEFLFAADGKGPVNLKDVSAEGERRRELRQWGRALRARTKDNVRRLTSARARAESWAMLGIVAAVVVWALSIEAPGAPLLIGVTLVAWLVALRFMPERLEKDVRARVQRWKAFRRFLKEFSSLPEAPAMAVVIWEEYLVLATALGVAEEVGKQVAALVPPEELPAPFEGMPRGIGGLYWVRSFHLAHTPGAIHTAFVSSSPSGAFSSGAGSFSSGGGFGGGFSGGGGGGGGGTGGGAG